MTRKRPLRVRGRWVASQAIDDAADLILAVLPHVPDRLLFRLTSAVHSEILRRWADQFPGI